jgi:hypothetical protein
MLWEYLKLSISYRNQNLPSSPIDRATIERRELIILEMSKDRKGIITENAGEMIEQWK